MTNEKRNSVAIVRHSMIDLKLKYDDNRLWPFILTCYSWPITTL